MTQPTPGAHWRAFAAAPHRFFFATGIGFILLLSTWWLAVIAARQWFGASLEPVIPGLFAHGMIMLYLVFPPFMFGFLLTVYPRWQVAPEVPAWIQASCFGLLHLGLLLLLTGLYSLPMIHVAGWLVIATGWLLLLAGLAWSRSRCDAPVVHANAVLFGMAAGITGLLLGAWMFIDGRYMLWPYVVGLGTWPFLATVYFTVCHRMVPFFTSRVVNGYTVYRPDWMLRTFIGAAFVHALLSGHREWLWLPDLVMLLVAGWLAWRWLPGERHGNRLLSVLHISVAWLVVALALQVFQDIGLATGMGAWLGRAPIHALGFGFFGGMLIAMATRVTMGHSGRPLRLDGFGWAMFLLLQLATVLRIAAEILPGAYSGLLFAAALGWLLAFGGWAARYAKIYFQPRIDGRPG